MAGFQSVPNTAEFEALFRLGNGQEAQFSFRANNDAGPWDATQLNAARDAYRDAIVAELMPVVCDAHEFLGVRARDLEVRFGRMSEAIEAAPVAGSLASPSLPGNVAVVVKLFCDIGPPRQGRVFGLPPTEAQVDGDTLTGAAQTALQDAFQAIFDSLDDLPNVAVVAVSRFSGTLKEVTPSGKKVSTPIPRDEAVVANVSSVTVQSLLGSCRRRHSRSG